MSTIKQMLEQLPEPYRSQAIKNTPAEKLGRFSNAKNPWDALWGQFIWDSSPEGNAYWLSAYRKFRDNSATPVLVPSTNPRALKAPWTPQEIERLKQLYPENGNDVIATLIDRSITAIAHKAHRLKLRKSEAFYNSSQSGRFSVKRKGLFSRLFNFLFR